MDKAKGFVELLREATAQPMVPVFAATVTAVTGETCTVKFGVLELEDVRLKATVNGATDYLLLEPAIGSKVLVASLTGTDLAELAVVQVDAVARFRYVQKGLEIDIDSGDGKVSVKNAGVSLLDIFDSLKTLLNGFKVNTPAGPSAGLLPDTTAAIVQFETKFKQLLK